RTENVEGQGEITIRQLVRNALRMRPDRIIVGEVRGGEAFDMFHAINTGHEGSITTVHANSTADALRRVEAMVVMAGLELPARIIREYIVGARDIIIQVARLTDGTRKITAVSEVVQNENRTYQIKEIFTFKRMRIAHKGEIEGYFTPTVYVPNCLDRLNIIANDLPESLFTPEEEETYV